MTDFKEVKDLKDPPKLSGPCVNTSLNLHLEMGICQLQGKVQIWWNLPEKWVMCDNTTVNIYDNEGKWIQAWLITPRHTGKILTEFDWGTGWSANLYAKPPKTQEIQIMRTAKIP
jgi:hypothetical protein